MRTVQIAGKVVQKYSHISHCMNEKWQNYCNAASAVIELGMYKNNSTIVFK